VHCTALGCGIGGLARSRPGTAPVSTVLSLYPILFLVSLPVADLLMINGHPQQSCPILGVRQICAGFGSRLHQKRLQALEREIAKLTDAIAQMGLSDALRTRLVTTEAEKRELQDQIQELPEDLPILNQRPSGYEPASSATTLLNLALVGAPVAHVAAQGRTMQY